MSRKYFPAVAVALFLSLLAVAIPLNAAEKKPPDTVILKGNPMGGVKFDHKAHVERASNKCETCHHPSRPEKPLASPQESCFDCHTKPPAEGLKVNRQGAFHNPTATAGTCIDCHKTVDAEGMKAPTKCTECHKRSNV
jgi:Class III cytochrome C family